MARKSKRRSRQARRHRAKRDRRQQQAEAAKGVAERLLERIFLEAGRRRSSRLRRP